MSLGTVLSRVTGVARLAAIAAALGVAESRLADTYNLANTAPNIIYELVLGGILTSVFVPVFVEVKEREGPEAAWRVASAVINLTLVILTALCIVGFFAAPLLAKIYSFRLSGAVANEQHAALTFLLRLFLPQIVFYGLTSVTTGLLNAHRRFAAPMYTPVLNNLAVIAVFVAFRAAYGATSLQDASTTQLTLIGLGTTTGVVLMAFAQLPFLRGLGRYRFVLSAGHPAVGKLLRLSGFVAGYVVVNQIGYLIVQVLANGQRGGYTAYVAAFTFFQLPHGLFAVSIITALMPDLSRHAAAVDWAAFRATLSLGIRTTLLLILPAAVGYLLVGQDAVRLLLDHGVVTGASVELVSGVLAVFAVGLVPFSAFQILLRGFYALQDTRTPFMINCASVTLNTIANFVLFPLFGVKGLAAGHAIAYATGAVLLGRALSRRVGGMDGRNIARSAARVASAAAGMAAVVIVVTSLLRPATSGTTGALATVAAAIVAGTVSFVLVARWTRVDELAFVWKMIGKSPGGNRFER